MNKSDLKFKNVCDLYLNEGILGTVSRRAGEMGAKVSDFAKNKLVPGAKKVGDFTKNKLVPVAKKVGSAVGKGLSPTNINKWHSATAGPEAGLVAMGRAFRDKKDINGGTITTSSDDSFSVVDQSSGNRIDFARVGDKALAVYKTVNKTPPDIYYVDIVGNEKVVYKCTACNSGTRPNVQSGSQPPRGWVKLQANDLSQQAIIVHDNRIRGTNLRQISVDVDRVLGV